MLKNTFKQKIKSPLNLLWLLLFPAIYKGLSLTLNNYNFLKNYVDGNNFDNEVLYSEMAKSFESVSGFTFFAEGTTSFVNFIVATLIVGIIYSARYIYDKNTGFGAYCITRKNYNKYFSANVISAFSVPFVITFIVFMIVLVVFLIAFGSKPPSDAFCGDLFYDGPFKNMWFRHPLIMSMASALNVSFIVGMYSLIGLGFSAFIRNRFLISISPFAVYLISIIVPQMFPIGSDISKVMVYFFTEYMSTFFVLSQNWYYESAALAYIIHAFILIATAGGLLAVLYHKDKNQYIR